MLDPQLLYILAAYSAVLITAILLGGQLPHWVTLTHTRMQLVMSFVSGLMLGIAIFHLLPHAIYTIDSTNGVEIVARWTMGGLLLMFLLLRVFHFHHHDIAEDAHDAQCVEHPHDSRSNAINSTAVGIKTSWLGIALGLTIHTMIDGVALAASMQADFMLKNDLSHSTLLLGLGVFLAILFHKPLDALTISAMMSRGNVTTFQKRIILLGFALICPLSALVVLWGFDFVAHGDGLFVGSALAFSAGIFLCISLSDLLPEVHFHSHDRLSMTVALLLGVGLSLLLINLESDYTHVSVEPVTSSSHHVSH